MNAPLVRSTLVGALGGLLFGFDTAVIAGITHQLTQVFHLSAGALGLTVSIALWGTVAGAIGAGPLGQKIGGREALRIMAVLYLLSSLGCALAWNWPSLLVFRLIGGLGIGGSSVLGPVYLAELAPARLRGRLHSRVRDAAAIGFHYDQPLEFYAAFLDPNLVYSCQEIQPACGANLELEP